MSPHPRFTLGDLTPPGCCACGCGAKTRTYESNWAAGGRIKGEHRRYVRGHHSRTGVSLPIKVTKDGCWIWEGHRNHGGYGIVRRHGQLMLAHRWVYERLVGPIGPLVVDHLCRTPSCVNPEHLEAVTDAVNVRRGAGAKLTEEAVSQLREDWAMWQLGRYGSQREFARQMAPRLGVAPNTLRAVLLGTGWRPPKVRA